jgi:hypothetical protein
MIGAWQQSVSQTSGKKNNFGFALFSFFESRGRCYEHNFLRFLPIFGKKLASFSKTNVIIKILHNLALFGVKNANFFAIVFGENIFKIITFDL